MSAYGKFERDLVKQANGGRAVTPAQRYAPSKGRRGPKRRPVDAAKANAKRAK